MSILLYHKYTVNFKDIMVLCLVPTSVFAEEVGAEGSAAIQLGADAISVLSKNVNTEATPTLGTRKQKRQPKVPRAI